jgi:hypothetical protein
MTERNRYEPGGIKPARRAARVRRLTDPLGASGQRRTGDRIRREQAARRTLLAATASAFMALLGSIVFAAGPNQATPPTDTGIVYAIDEDGNVQAVRVVDREVAQVRTRSS